MGELLDAVVGFFSEDDWPFTQLENTTILRTGFSGDNGNWACFAQVREEQQQFVFYSILSIKVPEEKRPAIAEFLTRANYGMIIGNFELDFRDGEVRYKTSIDVEDDRLSFALIRRLVYPNVFTMDRYLPGIMAVTYGQASPAEAIGQIEG